MQAATAEKVWQLLEDVYDPEIPVLSVVDLGVVRDVQVQGEEVCVTITPTYSGCPAMGVISTEIRLKLLAEGFANVEIDTQLRPAWTSDWLSEAGKQKLEEYGIAPPVEPTGNVNQLFGKDVTVRCPRCKSENTKLVSQFGSTSCKALYQCNDCLEPFDYFKCLK
ncbi:phenylacetate-CoA oxygenase subunit PaaJ [Pontibacter mangrovi]|uniref:Phenylacetate-CoA oxygenase subunit PaaJ n=2 Tax=Pontibacter mangrovi TaxID=2589816 RepID=A0A501WAN4_9BACT|nr:phenylacetate-CoA oxygenase subunit PaaJ [Pontibacter mangrovi]